MKIGVVIVTYNRLDKLKKAIKSYENQSFLPEYILIVDNNSSDDTKKYLNEWKLKKSKIKKYVLFLKENTGGSGGFYNGLKKSLNLDADWIWVADDDAYPKKDAFEIGKKYIENTKYDLSAICGKVLKSDGKSIDYSHRRKIYKTLFNIILQPYSKKRNYDKNEFEINGFSYVGTMINKNKLKLTDLTKKDYFIYYDDTEHSYRLSKLGKIICLPNMCVVHDAPHSNMNQIVKWKLYYLVRNTLDFIKSNFSDSSYKIACTTIPFKFRVAVLLFGSNKNEGFKMIKEAVKDAKNGKTGLHDLYKPGWNPKKNN